MKNALIVATSGTLQSSWLYPTNIFAHHAKGGVTMKKRRKFNFWELLPKIAPWIMVVWALKYSSLNTEQTIIMIVACLTVCFGGQAIVEDFRKD